MVAILAIVLSGLQFSTAAAQEGDGIDRNVNAQTGKLNFISPTSGRPLPAAQALGISPSALAADPAMALAERFGPEFGLRNPAQELTAIRTQQGGDGRVTVRYQQTFEGVPVLGGELIVNTNASGDLYSVNGEVSANLALPTQAALDPEQARLEALTSVAKWYQASANDFQASEPSLWIFDESLLRRSTHPAELVWRMDVTAVNASTPVRELVLINAQRGGVSLHFNQIDTVWSAKGQAQPASAKSSAPTSTVSKSPSLLPALQVRTYTANNGTSLPGTLLCTLSSPNCTNGANLHADKAHIYAIGTYNLYKSSHGRNGIDNNNLAMVSTVHYKVNYQNAFWSGAQMVYGDGAGFPLGDDVVAHELTHGVTQYESNLFYYYQSGAINESFSDVWGEYYDQTNGAGNDTAGVKWLMGEDVAGMGALRNMSNPPAFNDPDMMSSAFYYEGALDSGGVHTNSGLNNKAAFLMVEGGTFNGRTVTALGWTKTAAIYYESQTRLLSSGADYADLYSAMQQACYNLIGQKGITAANCTEVRDALEAVEMSGQPATGFNPDAPMCTGGNAPFVSISDDLEAGTGRWTFNNGANLRWQRDSGYFGPYAQSGLHSLYADDFPATVTDATARWASFFVPGNAYLHFAHAYDLESGFDGGVLEYSINGGATWFDAAPLIEVNSYNGTISSGFGNPLGGRQAFTGTSHGYISTRLNLAPLAGQTAIFRWRLGLDTGGFAFGWWVDNVKVYRCGSPNIDVFLGGILRDSYFIPPNNHAGANFVGASSGPVKVVGTGSVLTSEHEIYKVNGLSTSFSEIIGLPNNQLDTTYWFPWYNNVSMDTQLRFGNVSGSSATVQVFIGGGAPRETFSLGAGQSARKSYAGVNSGPVKIVSTQNIVAAERVIFKNNTTPVSFSEMMGMANGQVSSTIWFPWYNNVNLETQLRITNVGGAAATVQVFIGGGAPRETFSLAAGVTTLKSYAGVDSGPVRVVSTQNTVATERVFYKVNNVYTSFSELMGLPDQQLSNTFWMPTYNNNSPYDTQLRIANASGAAATVQVFIAGTLRESFNLGVGASVRKSYVGVNNGPVKIVSTQNIVAAERVIFTAGGVPTSFTEMMALPNGLLDAIYWLPWYNNVDLVTQLRLAVP